LKWTREGLWVKIFARLTSIFYNFPSKPLSIDYFTHDKLIYHKNLFDFSLRYLNTHLGNTLLVDDMPYKTCLYPPFNVIFVESYEYAPKEDNYLMKTFFPYLEFLHNFGLSVPTIVKLYSFGSIKSIKEDDVKLWTLFERCTMACSISFYKSHSTSVISSPNIFFCSFLPMLFWIFQSHRFLWSIYFHTFTTTIFLFFLDYWCALSWIGKR
jgi:hypothetical protein